MGASDNEATEPTIFGAWFDGHMDTDPKPFETTWGGFVEALCALFATRGDKYGNGSGDPRIAGYAPGFSLARFVERDGTVNRDKRHVDVLSGVVLDFDKNFDPDVVFERVSGLAWVAYTTYSHLADGEQQKWRLVIPFATPIPGTAYKAVRAWVLMRINGSPNKKTQEADRIASSSANFFFGPGCPPEREDLAEWRVSDGPFLELPPLSALKRGIPEPRILGSKIEWPWLTAKMQTYKDPEIRTAFRAVLKGKPFAAHGARDATLQRMCGALAGWALACDPLGLASVFAPSLQAMEAENPDDPPPDVDNAADKIARAQSSMIARSREEIELVLAGPGIAAPDGTVVADGPKEIPLPQQVDDEQAETWAAGVGLGSADDLRLRLLLRTNKSIWIWRCSQGTWTGPYVEGSALMVARKELAAFPGVSFWVRGTKGPLRQKTLQEMLDEYGEFADVVSYDFGHERAVYDPEERRLILPGAARRPLEPERDPFVEEWLAALGGARAEQLRVWIAGLTMHERPNSVLFIKGKASVGKGLLVRGLARVWATDTATEMQTLVETAHGSTALLKCPLVWIDEGKWDKFTDVTQTLRKLVTQTSRTVNPKNLDLFELCGHARYVATANNFNLFESENALTPDDRDAVAERFLEIAPDAERAFEILQSIPYEERNALAEQDRIARHALWLKETTTIQNEHRLIAPGDRGGRFAFNIITDDHGWGSWTVEWLARWLSDPPSIERDQSHLVWRGNGRAIVSPEAVVNTFERVLRNKKPPQFLEISNALLSLSTGKLIKFPNDRGGKGYDVLVEEIAHWSEEKGSGNAEAIRANAHGAVGAGLAPAGKILNMRKEEK